MIVMDFIDGVTLFDYNANDSGANDSGANDSGANDSERILEDITKAVNLLHERDLVFGDLRSPNILINKQQRAMLVDFDWCEQHTIDRYPWGINKELS